MLYQELQNRRNNYAYPAVALQGTYLEPEIAHFKTTWAMDKYINNLLLSENAEEMVLGYLSVVFWGFYSGQDGLIRHKRALGRIGLARDGKDRVISGQNQRIRGVIDHGGEWVADYLSKAKQMIDVNNYSEALNNLNNLPQLQIAFSSKVCAFIDPTKCGVIDSVIVKNYPKFGFTTDHNGIVLNRVANRHRYNEYCLFLQRTANEINDSKIQLRWSDRDNQQRDWRALDVERAMY